MARVWDVLRRNFRARFLYDHLLYWGIYKEQAQNAVVLLLWLEMAMGMPSDIIGDAAVLRDYNRLGRVVMEADAVMRFVHDGTPLTESVAAVPAIAELCASHRYPGLVDYSFFRFHRGIVSRGIRCIRAGVAAVVFDETYQVLRSRYWAGLLGDAMPPPLAAAAAVTVTAELEDFRSVFVSFSNGFPVSKRAIYDFFSRENIGPDYIERITTETDVLEGETPKHGLVVFYCKDGMEDAMRCKTRRLFRIDRVVMTAHRYE
ncbi:hypothetical protein GUJ93_ZPchr0004g40359 [Zizania palustris]|uniref:Uncharacterized protein n=1 Tax=Zizania palustris TaxID=103762 RepID=A0A8J5S4W3_ZIZPA|nr:hypothetical protein GUJ93_ZPchr0004g40359 [Zizania palustris]